MSGSGCRNADSGKVTQIKGDGEAHPFLSPNDEFADYYNWDVGNLDLSAPKTDNMLAREYARAGLKTGLALEAQFGTNPYKFGVSGATDSHTGLVTAEEENFFGKHTGYEPSPERLQHPFMKTEHGELFAWEMLASGLTAVWAEENTRESIYDAMARKEVYATTGPRIAVRFFGGWTFDDADLQTRIPATVGYANGSRQMTLKGGPTGRPFTLAKIVRSGSLSVIQTCSGEVRCSLGSRRRAMRQGTLEHTRSEHPMYGTLFVWAVRRVNI